VKKKTKPKREKKGGKVKPVKAWIDVRIGDEPDMSKYWNIYDTRIRINKFYRTCPVTIVPGHIGKDFRIVPIN